MVVGALAGCAGERSEGPADSGPAASASAAATPTATSSSSPGPSATTVPAEAPLPGRTEGCAEGMVRVEGSFCPVVFALCEEHHPDWVKHKGEKGVAERCLRYREPTRCLSKKRRELSYCMDRWEYPNKPGELPRVLTSWEQAAVLCKTQGKRLCTETEFTFACEGPEMRPYVYGYVRDASVCNQDRDYRLPDHERRMRYYDSCLGDARCAEELARLDQRHRIGERKTCVAWAGNFDLNGNVNEWVVREGQKAPERSGLMGGWWGPIRSRCRAITTFHPEHDYGYEVGFRCCSEVAKPK